MEKRYTIGVDFGSDSVRALIVDVYTGKEMASAIAEYPRWSAGKYQNPQINLFRQHPLDYMEALTSCVCQALDRAGKEVRLGVAALSVDTTGSTPCPVNREGLPLALLPEFQDDPDAMFHLWKDHTAVEEARRINEVFSNNADRIDYTHYQGDYASEWFWAKILHTIQKNPNIRKAAYTWVEHSDWIPALLTGNTRPEGMYRCACAAGHKAYWHSAWGGLPSQNCLATLDPYLVQVRKAYTPAPQSSTYCLGKICKEWAQRLHLESDVLIGGSSFDAHAGAVGAGVGPETMVVNLGTSAVDMFVVSPDKMRGKSFAFAGGAAENSILPGMIGIEAGQAAFGDVYAWFARLLTWPLKAIHPQSASIEAQAVWMQQIEENLLPTLQRAAEAIHPEDAPIALDWFNGRRYPYVNEKVHSAIADIYMGTDAPGLYRSLITATALGQKRIIETLEKEGISVSKIVAVGGIAQKSSLLMQTLADALGKNISVSQSTQACARGAAMYAAVAAGIYPDLSRAQAHMCEDFQRVYFPNPEMQMCYARIYQRYLQLSEYMDPQLKMK